MNEITKGIYLQVKPFANNNNNNLSGEECRFRGDISGDFPMAETPSIRKSRN
jgi:hypothetical protein